MSGEEAGIYSELAVPSTNKTHSSDCAGLDTVLFLRGSSRRECFQQNSSTCIARLLNAKERGQRWRDFHGAGGLEMAPWSNARSHHNQWHVSASYNRGSMSAFKTCPEATAASASFA